MLSTIIGAVAGAVLGGGEEQGQNEQHQVQGNGEARSATQLASDANVLRPSFVLSQSNAERIRGEEEGSRNIAPNDISNELGVNNEAEEDPSTEEEEEEEDDDDEKEERKQAPHPLFDTSADKMPYAPGQQQVLGNRTLDRLQLPGAESDVTQAATSTEQPTGVSSSGEATVSGLGYLTNSSGGLHDIGSRTISGATGSRNTSNETSSASPSKWECQDWSSGQSSTLDEASETSLGGPPHALLLEARPMVWNCRPSPTLTHLTSTMRRWPVRVSAGM